MSGKREYFAAEHDEARYYTGPCETPEDAVRDYVSDNEDELNEKMADGITPTVQVGVGRKVLLPIDGHRIIDDLYDWSSDNLYEDALEPLMDLSNELKNDLGTHLTRALHEWLKEKKLKHEFDVIDPHSTYEVVVTDQPSDQWEIKKQ